MIIIVDSREQTPLSFPDGIQTRVEGLPTGDYSIEGLTSHVALERKSLEDLVSCITSSRERFEHELHRLQAYPCRAVLIEAGFSQIVGHRYRSKVSPASVTGSLAAWTIRYQIPFLFCGDPDGAAAMALSLMRNYIRIKSEEVKTFQKLMEV